MSQCERYWRILNDSLYKDYLFFKSCHIFCLSPVEYGVPRQLYPLCTQDPASQQD